MKGTPVVAFAGGLTTSLTTVYTGKVGKVFTIKSIIVSNNNSGPMKFTIYSGNYPITWAATIPGSGSLVIPVVDQVVLPGETIQVRCDSGLVNNVTMRISGIETDGLLSGLGLRVSRQFTNNTYKVFSSPGKKRILKSMVICNLSGETPEVRIMVGDYSSGYTFNNDLATFYKILPYQTIIVPFMDAVIDSNETLIVTQVASNQQLVVHVVTKDV
ncbi:hypothetical protein SAMN05428987_3836 [Paenibacillus sp. CF095]|uniref:hypothetical protein n=1 Tax=Paenibacillus sp. CF095 TaxID=1881033 RepID=UPI0008823745|nr:hypothetical protein [Paenibacillus sp. CF095]SDD02327.1 hypothetical protein SAMN05428987_3836 [Paenibacillus sp. CF095]